MCMNIAVDRSGLNDVCLILQGHLVSLILGTYTNPPPIGIPWFLMMY